MINITLINFCFKKDYSLNLTIPINAVNSLTNSAVVSFWEIPDYPLIGRRKKVVKLTFANINWRWHLRNIEERTSELVTKFVFVMKIKSIQNAELGRMWVVPSITWFKLCCATSSASSAPWKLVESPFYHSEFLALESPIYMAIIGEQSLILMIVSYYLCLNRTVLKKLNFTDKKLIQCG